MKYAIEYQQAAQEASNKAFVAREICVTINRTNIYDNHVAMSDYRFYSKRAAQYAKLAMMYREQGF